MARETGVVTKIDGSRATVKTRRSAACEGCSEKSTCHSMGGAKDMEIEALNPVQAGTGDTVTLEFATGRMLKLSLLLYIFPIVALLVGAIIGDQTAKSAGMDASILAAIMGFAGFLLAMAVILALEKKARNSDKYKPTIVSARRTNEGRQGDREIEKCELCH